MEMPQELILLIMDAYALKALSPERVTGKQIEAARVALN